jgi:RHS repeat-associated protein
VIGYAYQNGRISEVTMNGTTVLNQVLYAPFGPTRGWQWGNGTFTVREYDMDGQLTTLDSAGASTFTFNPDGTIASRADDVPIIPSLPSGLTTLSVSNSSNRISSTTGVLSRSYSYDAVGNTLGEGTNTFTYGGAGRMTSVSNSTSGTAQYLHNVLGERVKKSGPTGTTYFVYDEAGHLLGEYDGTGNRIEELVWLGDIPVASIRTNQSGNAGVFYIHTDHLNAPMRLTEPATNTIIWRWDHDPFGNGAPDEDPDGNGLVARLNLRFPGQYYDAESGLSYNYFRDYDPATGRYTTSDPIGLAGGINTYAYVRGNPIRFIDPYGLQDDSPQEPCTPAEIRSGTCRPRVPDNAKACEAADAKERAEQEAIAAAAMGDAAGWYRATRRAQDELYRYHEYLGQPIPGERPAIPSSPPNGPPPPRIPTPNVTPPLTPGGPINVPVPSL